MKSKKRIVIVSPQYNGLMKYSEPLHNIIKEKLNNEYELFYVGSPAMSFDKDEIEKNMESVSNTIINLNPDLIHYNYGTYDADQLLPYYLDKKGFKCKQILTYHSLQLDLFKKIQVAEYDEKSNYYVGKMDGYCFFTNYGKNIFEEKYGFNPTKSIVSYHPATHGNMHLGKEKTEEYDNLFGIDRTKKIATLIGYPSHWKETGTLIKLATVFKDVLFVVGGPWWKEKIIKEHPDLDLKKMTNIIIVNKELDTDEFLYFLDLGVGIFPYQYFKSFQGSGLLPNYLYRGTACICNDIIPMKEYLSDENYCFDFNDNEKLFKAFSSIIDNPFIKPNEEFSYQNHADKICEFYKEFDL